MSWNNNSLKAIDLMLYCMYEYIISNIAMLTVILLYTLRRIFSTMHLVTGYSVDLTD